MIRRSVLEGMAALAAGSAVDGDALPNTEAPEDGMLAPLNLEMHRKGWIREQLHSHYGAAFMQSPNRGIYHLYADRFFGIPSRDAIVQRARLLCELETPRVSAQGWDCEDEALRLRQLLCELNPRLSVGVAFSLSSDHAFNVFLTGEGEVVEFEPQTGSVVPASEGGDYDFSEGVLLF